MGSRRTQEVRRTHHRTRSVPRAASRYASAIQNAGVAIAFASPDGRLTEANTAFCELFGFRNPDEVAGSNVGDFADDPTLIADAMNSLLTQGAWVGELSLRRKDGRPLTALVSASAVLDDAGAITEVLGSFVDVSDKAREEETQRRVHRALTALAESRAAIAGVEDATGLLHAMCAALVSKSGYRMAWIGEAIKDAAHSVRVVAQAGDDKGYLKEVRITWDDSPHGRGPTGTAVRTQKASVNNDAANNTAFAVWRDAGSRCGFRSSAAIPVLRAGARWGVLNVYASEPDAFDSEELALLQEIAGDLSRGLDFLDGHTATEESRRALLESEARFRTVAENIREVMWMTEPGKEKMHYVSPAYETVFKRTRASLYASPMSWVDAIHPADRERVRLAALTQQIPGTYDEEYRIVRPDGTTAWIHDRAVAVRNESGDVHRIVGIAEDVTEAKLAEIALAKREREQMVVAELGQRALEGVTLDELMSDAARQVGETLNTDAISILELHPDARALTLRAGFGWPASSIGHVTVDAAPGSHAGFVLATGAPVIVTDSATETRFAVSEKQREMGVISSLGVVIGKAESPYGVMGAHARTPRVFTADDVHFLQAVAHIIGAAVERKSAESALREHEAYFRSLIEQASDSITVIDASGIIQFQSPAAERLLGLPPSYFVGRSAFDVIHPDDAPRVAGSLAHAMQSSETVSESYRIRHRDGSWRHYESVGRAMANSGVPVVVVNSRDVTERNAERRRLEESQAQLAQQARLLDKMQAVARIGGWEIDSESSALSWTDGMYAIHETPRDVVPSEAGALQGYAPASRQVLMTAIDAMRRDGTGWDLELQLTTAKGREIWVRNVAEAQLNGDKVSKAFGAIQDITEHRQLIAQLLQSQKLDAIGQLSAGVAHDFNNLLTVIGGNASILEANSNTPEERREGFESIREAVSRAASLTRQLLLFSRQQLLQAADIDLNASVSELTKMLRRILGADIEMELKLSRDPLMLHADPGMLDQVLLNLVVNARDAMPKGGRLTIVTSSVHFDAAEARHHPQARPGGFVCLSVTDTGSGIPPEVLPRIFDPFFTTKAVGKGSGLGLATLHGIVQQHEGWVSVDSEVGRGTTFRVYLPRRSGSVSGRHAAVETAAPGGTETILIAEDEAGVGGLLQRALSRRGYTVLLAGSGAAALQRWNEVGGRVDLLLSDLVMPDGMTGVELATALRGKRAGLPVVFMSGYSKTVLIDGHDLESSAFLQKPFGLNDAARTIRSALDAAKG